MGKDSPWEHSGLNCASSSLAPPDLRQQRSTNPMVFPSYANPFGCAFPGNAQGPFPGGLALYKLFQMNSVATPPWNSSAFGAAQKRKFMVFDQSGDRTELMFSTTGSPFPCPSPIPTHGTEVSDGHGSEEMHENSEEIDALLYSDSEDDGDEEEEASTGHSPLDIGSTEEVPSSSAVPAKRRRIDAALVDTASSAGAHFSAPCPENVHNEDSAESSCVRGVEESPSSKRVKRERIQETVGVLRRIIPGGRGKDAAAVLDEAIRYLRSLKLKSRAMGATTTTPIL